MRSAPLAGLPGARLRAAAVLAGTAAALGALAPGAHADFTTLKTPCSGSALNGTGSSFQNSAFAGFKANFGSSDFCGASAPDVSYTATDSGSGRGALGANATGARDATARFGGSDSGPTPAQRSQIEKGPLTNATDTTVADDGVLHVVPVAIGAVAVDVNFPDGCTIPPGSLANAASSDGTDRVKLPADLVEKAFAADTTADTWGELVPNIGGAAGVNATYPALACADIPIRRVVRPGSSGTTTAFKDFLSKFNAGRGWTGLANLAWPNTVGDTTGSCPTTSNLCRAGGADGGGALVTFLGTVDGALGYAALSDSRARGFESTPSAPPVPDTTFWAPIQNTVGGPAYEPTADAAAYKAGAGVRGSNCASAPLRNVPGGADPTLGDWSVTSTAGDATTTTYPVCTLTYDLVFDDNAPPFGNNPTEEAKARTLKDYFTSAVSSLGQATLPGRDYSQLPASIKTIAQNGVTAIGWNKSAAADTGGGTNNPPAMDPPSMNPPAMLPSAIVKPSNVFTIPSASVKSTTLKLSLQIPGAGTIKATATARYKGKTVKIGTATGKATAAGKVSVTIKTGKSALKTLKKAKKLSVKIAIVYTPTGGTAKTVNAKTLTIKTPKVKAKKKKK